MEGKGNRAEERVVNNENTHNGTQASSNKLRVQQYASYLHGITNYLSENLPLALRSLHTTTSSSHQPKGKNQVVWLFNFQKKKKIQFLVLLLIDSNYQMVKGSLYICVL